jgi:aspartate aminotransferase
VFVPAARVQAIRESPSTQAAQRVRDLRAAGRTIVDLTVGEPDFDTPDHVKAAAGAAMDAGLTKYTPVNGIPALREAIAAKVLRRTGQAYGGNEIAVGGGAKQVIFLALMAGIDPGDEVIVPAPYWVSYPDMVAAHGGVPVVVPCACSNPPRASSVGPSIPHTTDGFRLTPQALEAAITPRTRWLVLNAPGNPTGTLYTPDELAALADVLDRHPRVVVLCDEIYDEITFTDRPATSLVSVAPRLRERILLVNGVSKTYAMTGWRLGWGLGDPGLIGAVNTLQSQSSSCPSSISQAAAVAALTGDGTFVRRSVAAYRERRDLIHGLLADVDGLAPVRPDGSFYLFVNCAGLLGRTTPDGATLTTDNDVVLFLLDHASVATIPGSAYGSSPYFRVSFAAAEPTLKDAAAAIGAAVATLR